MKRFPFVLIAGVFLSCCTQESSPGNEHKRQPANLEQQAKKTIEQMPARGRTMSKKPTIIAINHDDYHAKHIGRTSDGRQFFLTTPFEPSSSKNAGSEFVALHIFDSSGNLLEARIDNFGPRATVDEEKLKQTYEQRLKELGKVSFERIEVKPFSVSRFGLSFGLILREPKEADDVWAVELLPGNFMAFFEPWDSGDYDT